VLVLHGLVQGSLSFKFEDGTASVREVNKHVPQLALKEIAFKNSSVLSTVFFFFFLF
jgi:hypothetical protein